MTDTAVTAPTLPPTRLASMDAFRGLTILIMIFVNDVAGVKGIPWWMKHADTKDDFMTFVDLVFPAFLFIVGMAIPFAIGRRRERGEALWRVWAHVLVRTAGLLIVGVFMVNMPANTDAMGFPAQYWSLAVYLAVILVWNDYPKTDDGPGRWLFPALRGIGIGVLITMAIAYRGKSTGADGVETVVRMRTQWWGILGLIGWAYLVGCACYLPLRKQIAGMVGMITLLSLLFVADDKGLFNSVPFLPGYVGIGSQLGSHGSIVVAGCVLGMLFFAGSSAQSPRDRIIWMLVFGLGLVAAAWMIHPLYIISKNLATPTWCLMCSGICCWLFAAIYLLMDVWGFTKWAAIIRPAGENPLLAYILPSIVGGAITCFGIATGLYKGNPLWSVANAGGAGIVRSVVWAFAIVALTGLLGRIRVRLRL
ncbi:MAG: DUF5009 domain-containing protein [Candidatus Sumerlaeaceae bacterium]|nr:DUF5009 domain-containing protein [Candidatus Sumerlaeaceae bacterium]